MRYALNFLFILLSFTCYAQAFDISFLKKDKHKKGQPSVTESLNWIEKQFLAEDKEGDVFYSGNEISRFSIDRKDEFRENQIPCFIKHPYFEYNQLKNTLSFKIDNMGCYLGAYPIERAEITIFLFNLDIDSIKIEENKLFIKNWNDTSSLFHLGYIIYENYDSCGGNRIKTFNSISFPLHFTLTSNIGLQKKLIQAFYYIGQMTSAKRRKCFDFGG